MMTPWAVMTAIMAPIAGSLADRYPAGILGGIGLSILAGGFVLLALLPAEPAMTDVLWRVAVCGFGFGFFQSPNNRAIVTSAPRERSGGAGAIQGTVASARAIDRRGAGRAGIRRFRRHARRDRRDPGGGRLCRGRRTGEPEPPVECGAPPAQQAADAHSLPDGAAAREPAE